MAVKTQGHEDIAGPTVHQGAGPPCGTTKEQQDQNVHAMEALAEVDGRLDGHHLCGTAGGFLVSLGHC